MQIDVKSVIIGALIGSCAVIHKAAVSVARDKCKDAEEEKTEEKEEA